MKLEFEKAMNKYLLFKKKQYTALFVHPEVKHSIKGLAPVRRDCCPTAAECGVNTLLLALETRDEVKLLAPFKKALKEIEDPNIPLSRLEKTVAKKPFYKNNGDNLIQKRLFDKIQQRTKAPVESGSRVGYIVTLPQNGRKRVRGKDDRLYLDGEQTAYCIDNQITPDREYYVVKQLLEPTLRFLSHTKLAPTIRKLAQSTLDKIWVQNTKNRTIHHYFPHMNVKSAPLHATAPSA
jgi:DNA polymerase elongation subunit (family B)